MPLRRLRDDEQAEAGAFDALRKCPRRAVEAAEDALGLVRGNGDALVAYEDDGQALIPLQTETRQAPSRAYFTACPAGEHGTPKRSDRP